MEIGPILSSLRRNKVGAVLIAMQIALTLAIVCNSLFLIREYAQSMQRPSGVDEPNMFTMSNQWVDIPDEEIKARLQEDLVVLRSTPGVVDATVANSFPLRSGGWSTSIDSKPIVRALPAMLSTAQYFVDEHVAVAWGARLIAGRWFTAGDVSDFTNNVATSSPVVIVSKTLADKLFPAGDALGKTVYFPTTPSTIVGIVERLQTPWPSLGFGASFAESSMLMPVLFVNNGVYYVVRTRPGERDAVMQRARARLMDANGARVIDLLRPFAETRRQIYAGERALVQILATVSVLLLGITAFGIVGLTSYWIAQRRRQIGVRRALGARRADILRYFQTENLLIAGIGVSIGVALAIAINLWMVRSFEMTRMGLPFVLAGAATVLLLGQVAVFWPALRAASIPPALATRAA